MTNLLVGLALGWVIFTSTGREAAMIAYYYMDQAGERIADRVAEDLPEPQAPPSLPRP
jgi:hypothetical protein